MALASTFTFIILHVALLFSFQQNTPSFPMDSCRLARYALICPLMLPRIFSCVVVSSDKDIRTCMFVWLKGDQFKRNLVCTLTIPNAETFTHRNAILMYRNKILPIDRCLWKKPKIVFYQSASKVWSKSIKSRFENSL